MASGSPDGEVVVGIDGSSESGIALEWAAAEADRRDLPLRILHCVEAGERPGHSERLLAQEARSLLDEAHERMTGEYPRLKVAGTLSHDSPVEAVLSAARTAGLVVLGTRGRGGFKALLLGSVSLRVAAHTPCPLVVVRGERAARPLRTVVAGVRDEKDAPAIRFAASAAARARAVLTALHAWGPLDSVGRVAPQVETVNAIRAEHGRILARAVGSADLGLPEPQLTEELAAGRTAAALVEASQEAELLVVGTHHPARPLGLLLAPAVHAVLHHANCPVAIVPDSWKEAHSRKEQR